MLTLDQARTLSGKTMTGAGGAKLGRIDTVYADREDGDPTFATVHTGAFGSKTHFVPLADATLSGDTVTVPYDKELVSSAPNIAPDAELEPEEERRLYSHYGVGGHSAAQGAGPGTAATTDADRGVDTDRDRDTGTAGAVGHDTSGPTSDNATTRSQERLDVDAEQTEAGRARLRKYVVTERETVTVPVSHEEVRTDREPITDASAGSADDGPSEDVRKEQIALGGDGVHPEASSGTTSTDRSADRP